MIGFQFILLEILDTTIQGRHSSFFGRQDPQSNSQITGAPPCPIPQNPGKTLVFPVLPLVEALLLKDLFSDGRNIP